ncbi:Transducin/WD40 repeat-like superfamily protein [Euphorbia peplus]|nr:Transducin/WD40 repeat-like superfamily protein [Euphorbia peplus]
MEKYLVPNQLSPETPKPFQRHGWTRSLIEVNGRPRPSYRHDLSALLMRSYSEVGVFPHLYHVDGVPCQTHRNRVPSVAYAEPPITTTRQGISSLEFDSKGIYLVSVTKSGCLTVHDFESLYCQANDLLPCLREDENKHVLHLSLRQQLDVVRWNPGNQDEVACTSMKKDDVLIFDISYISSEPVQVLRTKKTVTVHGSNVHKGLTDVAFAKIDKSRLLASDTNGVINMWDRRIGSLPCLELTTNCNSTINSIQLNVENQLVYGAGRHGIIYMWDLRGGRASAAFQSHKEMCHPPITSWKLATVLERIGTLKAQSAIVPKEVHSINFDPSCPYQLAFHLDDGWSGVLNMYDFEVTHVHCPPPAWLNDSNVSADLLYLRKPSWLPTYSVYAVGSASTNGIHLLDFYPDSSSPCHVDYSENEEKHRKEDIRDKQNKFIPVTEAVTASAAHPLNGTIIAGTKHSSLLVVSQKKQSF